MRHPDDYTLGGAIMVNIAVCENPEHPLMPLIGTLKFCHKELWCPACGRTYGFFDARGVEASEELTALHDEWVAKSSAFLSGETAQWEYTHKTTS
jgi:hypothetical protein